MNGYLIATECADLNGVGGRKTVRWMAITATYEDAIAKTVGTGPHLVSEGPAILRRARDHGLKDGEVVPLDA